MDYRELGDSGVEVSEVGFGAWVIGTDWWGDRDESDALEMVEYALDAFRDSMGRIRSMALIHEKLYQSEHLSEVDFPKYVEELCDQLILGYAQSEEVELAVRADEIDLDLETAISCGLIVNELVTNALDHGLPEDGGEVRVEINREDEGFDLLVSDTGEGPPDEFDPFTAESIGMKIVRSLVEYDLDGTLHFNDTAGGLTVRVSAPENVLNP